MYNLPSYPHAPADGAFSVLVRLFKPVANFYLKILLQFYFIKNKTTKIKTKHHSITGSKFSQLRKIRLRQRFCSLLYTLGMEKGIEERWCRGKSKVGVDDFNSEGSEKRCFNLDLETVDRTCFRQSTSFAKEVISGTWPPISQGFMIRPPCEVNLWGNLFPPCISDLWLVRRVCLLLQCLGIFAAIFLLLICSVNKCVLFVSHAIHGIFVTAAQMDLDSSQADV